MRRPQSRPSVAQRKRLSPPWIIRRLCQPAAISMSVNRTKRCCRLSTWLTDCAGLLIGLAISTAVIAAPPDPPTAVTARPGDTNVLIRWTAPVNTGGLLVTSYTATASPDGNTCTSSVGSPPATSCTVTGLTNDTPYTFTVTATTSDGTSLASTSSAPATPLAGTTDVNFIGSYGNVKWGQNWVGATGPGRSWPTSIYNSSIFPEFDTPEAHFPLTSSNGAGLRAVFRQTPRYTDC